MRVVHRSNDRIELAAGPGRRVDAALLIGTALICGLGGVIAAYVYRDALWLLFALIGLGLAWLLRSGARESGPARHIHLDAGTRTLSWTYRDGRHGNRTETAPLSRLSETRAEFTSDTDWLSFIDTSGDATILAVPTANAKSLSEALNQWLDAYRHRLAAQ